MEEPYFLPVRCTFLKFFINFLDCMPVLHLYLTVGTEQLLAVPERTQWLLEMCEKTLADDEADEDTHAHAAKLFEVFILQCSGRVDNFIPAILQLVLNRLQKNVKDELRAQLLIVNKYFFV